MSSIVKLSSPQSASSDSTSGAEPAKPKVDASSALKPQAASDQRAALEKILTDYNVHDDEMTEWVPQMGGLPFDMPFVSPKWMTRTEGKLLDDLASARGLAGLKEFRNIMSNEPRDRGNAFTTADRYYPRVDGNGREIAGADDGHNDAFRHAYFNALLTRSFGSEFAAAFATAHEGTPGNPASKEAMDLYNNEVGRRVAMRNVEALDDELAELIQAALKNGEMVVIDGAGELAFSDEVPVGQTGRAKDSPRGIHRAPPPFEPKR